MAEPQLTPEERCGCTACRGVHGVPGRECCVGAIRAAVAETWEAAATDHRRHCISLACREGKVLCNEYETYRAYAARARTP